MPARTPARTLATLVVLVLGALGAGVAPVASAHEAGNASAAGTGTGTGFPTDDGSTPSEQQAQGALAHVETLLAPTTEPLQPSTEQPADDASLALRDLAFSVDDLDGSDRARARSILARPTDRNDGDPYTVEYRTRQAKPLCRGDICIHYVTSTLDAVPTRDADRDGRPDYVEKALDVVTHVHDTYRAAGYRRPKGDGAKGGVGRNVIDIYLGDVGGNALYGYCVPDEPDSRPGWTRYGYCVLDNNFSRSQFPTNTPKENLQVTAAHEYFHATQFNYDAYEDAWLLEATATWAEDEVYDGVDDNVQYLRTSPLTEPRRPLDQFNAANGFHYGVWSFFRFLTERFPRAKGGLPTLVRNVINDTRGRGNSPGLYSWQAVEKVLRGLGTNAPDMLLAYGVANRSPAQSYEEGAANRYPTAPLARTLTLGRNGRTATVRETLAHLTTATVRFTPRRTRTRDQLKVRVDLAPRSRGSRAAVVVRRTSGAPVVKTIRLDRRGNGVAAVSFDSGTVRHVELTIANAGNRYRCGHKTVYSCQGVSRDDGVVEKLSARVFH